MHRLRLKNKRIKKKKRINEWVILLIIFFFIIIGVEFYEFIDRGSSLQSLGIKCSKVNPEELQKVVKLSPGTNLFKTNLKEIAWRLTKDSRIKSFHILKNLSERRVEIEINERIPFIKVLRSGTDKCLEVDIEGVIIKEAENISSNVPLITGLTIRDSSFGPEINDRKILEKAIEILKIGDSFNIQMEEISEVNLKDPNDIIIFTTSGIEIHLGNEDLYKRLKRASMLLAEIRKKGIHVKYVDLRFGEEAVTKMGG